MERFINKKRIDSRRHYHNRCRLLWRQRFTSRLRLAPERLGEWVRQPLVNLRGNAQRGQPADLRARTAGWTIHTVHVRGGDANAIRRQELAQQERCA